MTSALNNLGDKPSPDIDILKERNTLGAALLEATASLAQGESPREILKTVCLSLAAASEHIRLAWMILGGVTLVMWRREKQAKNR